MLSQNYLNRLVTFDTYQKGRWFYVRIHLRRERQAFWLPEFQKIKLKYSSPRKLRGWDKEGSWQEDHVTPPEYLELVDFLREYLLDKVESAKSTLKATETKESL